jgi:hypothetical protein
MAMALKLREEGRRAGTGVVGIGLGPWPFIGARGRWLQWSNHEEDRPS